MRVNSGTMPRILAIALLLAGSICSFGVPAVVAQSQAPRAADAATRAQQRANDAIERAAAAQDRSAIATERAVSAQSRASDATQRADGVAFGCFYFCK